MERICFLFRKEKALKHDAATDGRSDSGAHDGGEEQFKPRCPPPEPPLDAGRSVHGFEHLKCFPFQYLPFGVGKLRLHHQICGFIIYIFCFLYLDNLSADASNHKSLHTLFVIKKSKKLEIAIDNIFAVWRRFIQNIQPVISKPVFLGGEAWEIKSVKNPGEKKEAMVWEIRVVENSVENVKKSFSYPVF